MVDPGLCDWGFTKHFPEGEKKKKRSHVNDDSGCETQKTQL